MSQTKQTLSIYWQHTIKYKKQLLTIYPMLFTAQAVEEFVQPVIISSVLDRLAQGDIQGLRDDNIWLIFGLVLFTEFFSNTLYNILIRVYWRMQDNIMVDLWMSAFRHLEKMSFKFYADRFAGSLVSQVNKFVGSYERLTDALTWNVFKLLASFILGAIVLIPRAPLVVFGIFVMALIFVPAVWHARRKQIPFNATWAAAETRRTGQLADTITNILAVKSFSNERLEEKHMRKRVQDVHDRSMDTMRINMNHEFITGKLQRSINVVVVAFSVMLALNGVIEVGTIYLSLTITIGIMRRLWDLNNTFRNFTRVFGDAKDMVEIMQIEPEVSDPEKPVPFRPDKGHIQFNSVTFHYKDGDKDNVLFDQLDLDIKPGEKVGLVGPSGGGKTTITKLLLRFMDIQDGAITVDHQDISQIKQHDLRRYISYVPQEPLLFHRSLSENIAYGKTDATQAQIESAAKKAHAHEFITELEAGYDTLVGERGVKLSGGQKQRVAIARSMIKQAPIIVLDEATSALDSESEQLIQDALWKLMEGKTAIVIAHRLSTIQKMDRIIVLDNGQIVEEGTHNQLVKKQNGHYARLWQHQSGGFLEE